MNRRSFVTRALAALTIGAFTFIGTVAGAAPATAAAPVRQQESTPDAGAAGPVTTAPASADAAALTSCDTRDLNGVPGAYICEYGYTLIRWTDGRYQFFIVGTNYHVYTSYQYSNGGGWSGWVNLDGVARSGVYVTPATPSRTLSISVIGTPGTWYCKDWNGSAWTGWYNC